MTVLYVDSCAQGADDGSSWPNAFRELRSALLAVRAGEQIWVARGTYYPTRDADRDRSFVLVERVELYGGFAGGETRLEQRDWRRNSTLLSGNIGKTREENSRHVVRGADEAVLDGFIIEDGHALVETPGKKGPLHLTPAEVLAGSEESGAGIYNYRAAPVIRNTLIRHCRAAKGAGAYNMTASPTGAGRSPVYIDVTFRDNFAAARGGGMANDLGTNSILVNCLFEGNACGSKGGALYNDFACSPLLVNTRFRGNRARMAAAIGNDGSSSPVLVGCTIEDNVCDALAAGLYQGSYNANFPDWANRPVVLHCSIRNNRSKTHGPSTWLNWGESWMATFASAIDGWDSSWDDPELGVRYAALIALAEDLASLDALTVWDRYGGDLLSWVPAGRALELGDDRPGFGVDAEVVTSLELPNRVLRVDARSQCAAPDGLSWATAFSRLQQGIDAASVAGGGEVWVAHGTYCPGTKRTSSFVMKPKVGLFGGFAGDETDREARDWRHHVTVLSGALGGETQGHAYHVILGCANAVLDGFVVRDGRADGQQTDGFGGGLFNWGHAASPIVRNTLFTANTARDGGAIFCFGDVRAYFQNVTVTGNRAEMGGGLALRFGASVRLDDCLIADNEAEYRGGGVVVNYGSNPEFNRVAFRNNRTAGSGGAVWAADQASQYGGTAPVFRDCPFSGNHAAFDGGALANDDGASATLAACSFRDNEAQRGNALSNTHNGRLTLNDSPVNDDDVYSEEAHPAIESSPGVGVQS